MTTASQAAGPQSREARFYAHARQEGRHRDHLIPGAETLQDAAMIFAEHWLPMAVGEGADALSVIVRDGDTGEEQCFTVHLDSGDAEPCG